MGWLSLKAVKRGGGGLGHGKMDVHGSCRIFVGDLGGKIEQITSKYPGHGGVESKNGSKVLEVEGISIKRIVLIESFGMKKGTWVWCWVATLDIC